jgi:transcriptional regulator with XRE-family HTH domain
MARVSGKDDGERSLKRLGAAIRAQRHTTGLSQEALGDAAEIDRSHMGKIERGERNVTLLNLIKIAAALRMKPSTILAEAGL